VLAPKLSPISRDFHFHVHLITSELQVWSTVDGDSTHLWNICLLQRGYMVLYHRRLSSSYSLM
jgi:hypothetical protein